MSDGSQATPPSAPPEAGWRLSAYAVAVIVAVVAAKLGGFVAANDYELPDLGRVAWIAGWVSAGCIGVLCVVLRARPRLDVDRTAVAAAVLVWWWFSFDLLFRSWSTGIGRRVVQVALWTLIAVVAVRLAYALARHRVVRDLALAVPACLLVLLTAAVGSYRLGVDDTARPDSTVGAVPPLADGAPNIYWIILDEHARADQLEAFTGTDSAAFTEALTARDFEVSTSSWASYTRTAQSLASTLFADYVFAPGGDVENEYLVGGSALRGENPTIERLRAHGYRFVYAPAGTYQWSACTSPPADRCVDVPGGFDVTDDLGAGLVDLTPLSQLRLWQVGTMDLPTVAAAAEEEVAAGGPFVLVAHVMSPHWPFRYDADCGMRPEPVVPAELSGPERAAMYANEVRCLDEAVVDAVDRIVAVDPNALIVVQSDHGSGLSIDLHAPNAGWGDAALVERLAVLNAMRLPASCRADDRYAVDGQPLVNTFRIVLACLEGRDPDLLEHRAFLWPFNDLRGIEELDTARLVPESTPDG